MSYNDHLQEWAWQELLDESAPPSRFQDEDLERQMAEAMTQPAKPYSEADVLLTVKDLSEMIKIPEDTVRQLLSRREIPGFKINGHMWRSTLAQYREWLDAQTR